MNLLLLLDKMRGMLMLDHCVGNIHHDIIIYNDHFTLGRVIEIDHKFYIKQGQLPSSDMVKLRMFKY